MDHQTVQKDFDELSQCFAGLAGEYIQLQRKYNRLERNWERVIQATRETQYDQETIKEFKENLGGDFSD